MKSLYNGKNFFFKELFYDPFALAARGHDPSAYRSSPGAVPFGVEQTEVMMQVLDPFTEGPKRIMDLGCGNGFLAEILLRIRKLPLF